MTEQVMQKAIFGGGCFWCLDATFSRLRGVTRVVSGYAGGSVANPTYEQVSSGETGHAEVAEITFDPLVITYETLLRVFFTLHDPTTRNRQGHDVGTQYRSIILYADETERAAAMSMIEELTTEQIFTDPIVTEVKALEVFYPAEMYHQNYYAIHPEQAYCQAVIAPKVAKLRASFSALLQTESSKGE